MSADQPVSPDVLAPTLEQLLSKAKAYGAEAADAVATHGRSLSVSVRSGDLEDVDNSEGRDIGLRVMIGQRQACVSSSDLSDTSIDMLAERAVAMARLAPEDPYCGLADPEQLASQSETGVDLSLFDPAALTPDQLKHRAADVDKATRSVTGVLQAEGASASHTSSAIYFMTSHGFSAGWRSTRHGLSVSAIAEKDGMMERDYDYDGTRWLTDLKSTEDIGRTAGMRAVARLGARQIPSTQAPVLFDQRLSAGLVSALVNAISGPSIARGVSFLKDKMGETLFHPSIQIIDDPLRPKGHGSRPWDGEGLSVQNRHLIQDGCLQSWLLNTASARQLGLQPTGHASRGIGSPPGVAATNTYMKAGTRTPDALMQDMGTGLHVIEMFGPSLNNNTGDYSVGVAGFWIENGQPTFPVSEITIAGNLLDVYKTIIPANDLIFDGSISAPTLLAEGLTIAGT